MISSRAARHLRGPACRAAFAGRRRDLRLERDRVAGCATGARVQLALSGELGIVLKEDHAHWDESIGGEDVVLRLSPTATARGGRSDVITFWRLCGVIDGCDYFGVTGGLIR